jgi:hydrogenase maturation factor
MHDLTEGGLLGALDELRAATGLGADIREEALPVDEDVASVLRAFSIDPLSASSTGSLIAFCPARAARRALGALAESGVAAADIGAVTRGRVRLVDPRGGARAAQAGEDGYARFAARRHAGRGPRGVRTSPAGPPRRGRPRPGR